MTITAPGTASAQARVASSRLLSLEEAAEYLGISYWAVRDLITARTLLPVHLPLGRKRLRRVLLDRQDLDRLIERAKAA